MFSKKKIVCDKKTVKVDRLCALLGSVYTLSYVNEIKLCVFVVINFSDIEIHNQISRVYGFSRPLSESSLNLGCFCVWLSLIKSTYVITPPHPDAYIVFAEMPNSLRRICVKIKTRYDDRTAVWQRPKRWKRSKSTVHNTIVCASCYYLSTVFYFYVL